MPGDAAPEAVAVDANPRVEAFTDAHDRLPVHLEFLADRKGHRDRLDRGAGAAHGGAAGPEPAHREAFGAGDRNGSSRHTSSVCNGNLRRYLQARRRGFRSDHHDPPDHTRRNSPRGSRCRASRRRAPGTPQRPAPWPRAGHPRRSPTAPAPEHHSHRERAPSTSPRWPPVQSRSDSTSCNPVSMRACRCRATTPTSPHASAATRGLGSSRTSQPSQGNGCAGSVYQGGCCGMR